MRTNSNNVENHCHREVRERVVAALTGRKTKPRRLVSVACDVTKPMGEPLKLMRTLKEDARIGFAASWRILIAPQARSLAALHGVRLDTGEFEPPRAA